MAAARRPCDAPCREAARPFVLAATILGSAMAFIDGTIVHIALPSIQGSFDADFATLQWVVNIYALLLGSLILVGGGLGDRLGRRRVFMAGIVVFAVASVLCAAAPDAGTLVAARALQGIGAALLVPQSLAIIAASFPREIRGRAIGIWAGFAAITTAAGPILGGLLIDLLSWRAAFWVNLPVAAAALWLTLAFVPESRDEETEGRPDILGAVLVILGLGALTFALTSAHAGSIGTPILLAAAILGLGLLFAFVQAEKRSAAPMMPLGLFRSAEFSAANGVTLLLYFALSGILFLLPFQLIQIQGYSAAEAGLSLLPFGLIMGVFSGAAGRLADRFGVRLPLVLGPILVCSASIGFAAIDSRDSYWTAVLPPILLFSIGMTISVAPLTTAVMNAVEEAKAGAASGINNAASRLAGLLAVTAVGLVATMVFAAGLQQGLAEITVSAEVSGDILNRADQLAGLRLPPGLERDVADSLQTLVVSVFQDAFQAGMGLSALAAAAAGAIAFFAIGKTAEQRV